MLYQKGMILIYPNINEILKIIGFCFVLSATFLPLSLLLGDYVEKLDANPTDNFFYPFHRNTMQLLMLCCVAIIYFLPTTYIIFGFVSWFGKRRERNEKKYAEEDAKKEREAQERLKIEEDFLKDYFD